MRGKVRNCVEYYRLKKDLTQEELAKDIGVSRQTIISIEKGNYTPSVYLALKIGRVLRLPVEQVFECDE